MSHAKIFLQISQNLCTVPNIIDLFVTLVENVFVYHKFVRTNLLQS